MILIDEMRLDSNTIYHLGRGNPPGIYDLNKYYNYIKEVINELKYEGEAQ